MQSEERGRTLERRGPVYSRWTDDEKVNVPGLPLFVPDVLSAVELEALTIRYRIDEIGHKLAHNLLDVELRARSPSPTPIYDNMGKRVNTREQRAKDKLMAERQRLVERAKILNPSYRPPADYRPFSTKKTRKIYVPVKEYPDYNFIGLILGPRGFTQRQMEQDTGAKISLRGKGSVRDGKGRSATKDNNEDEDLHVIITADTEESLDHAETLVRRLLVPVEEGKNEIKRKQLRKLAEMNGTLRDSTYGHEKEERMKRMNQPEMVCRWCGETSHPSSDCNQRGNPNAYGRFDNNNNAPNQPNIDSQGRKIVTQDYFDLMTSLGEDTSNMVVQSDEFNQLLASIGHNPSSHSQQSGSARFSNQTYGGNRYGAAPSAHNPSSGSVDDIPPWERMDMDHQKKTESTGEEVLPWEMM